MHLAIALSLTVSAAAVVAVPQPDDSRERAIESDARVTVRITRPAVIRDGKPDAGTLERAKVTRRDGRVLVEFQ